MFFSRFRKLVLQGSTWARQHLTPLQVLIVNSMVVGLLAGVAAVCLKTLVHYVELWSRNTEAAPIFNVFLPVLGILITVWISIYFFGGKLDKGLATVLRDIARRRSIITRHKVYSQIVTSAVTVGMGGSAGLEAPIAVTGAAIGSNYAQEFGTDYRERTLLLAAGTAAGVAAVFNAPIAGVMFSVEVLLMDAAAAELLPLIVAAVMGSLVSKILLREDVLFHFQLSEPFNPGNIGFYLLMAVISGFFSVYYVRAVHTVERFTEKLSAFPYSRALKGGLILAVLTLVFPPLFGEGYSTILSLAAGHPLDVLTHHPFLPADSSEWVIVGFLTLTILLKVPAATLTIAAGGNGGNFAPSLFCGALIGYTFSHTVNLLGLGNLPESNFTLVGMCGALSGIMHAPLTAIFLIAEITGGYEYMIPLMLVSSMSFAISRRYERLSLEKKKLTESGETVIRDKDDDILTHLKTMDFVDTNYLALAPDAKLRDLVEIFPNSSHNIFPVLHTDGSLAGLILIEELRHLILQVHLYDQYEISSLMQKKYTTVDVTEPMRPVMRKFEQSGSWVLPVLKDGKFYGFISKAAVFSGYREELKNRGKMV